MSAAEPVTYLVTGFDPVGHLVQVSVDVDLGSEPMRSALACCSGARGRAFWCGYLAAAGHDVERVANVKRIAGHVAAGRSD